MNPMLVLMVLALLLVGGAGQDRPPKPEEALDLSGPRSGIAQPRKVLVRDAQAFEALWKEHSRGVTELPMPTVDFKKHDVVGYFAGSRPSGGFSVALGEIKRRGKVATVPITLFKPGPGDFVTLAFTQPFAIRAVPKLPRIVRFVVTERTR